jgi:hypothetical protein
VLAQEAQGDRRAACARDRCVALVGEPHVLTVRPAAKRPDEGVDLSIVVRTFGAAAQQRRADPTT